MNHDCTKLTVYFGERDRAGGEFLADALSNLYATHDLQTSLVLRGSAGYGPKQHLRTDRQLTLSEDLPVVSVAVDTRERIRAVASELERFRFDGLVTQESARMITDRIEPVELEKPTKLTIYLGRQQRIDGQPAYRAVVDHLQRSGVAGASVLLGVDGTAHGVRRRARFFASNADVPLMVIAVGAAAAVGRALAGLAPMLPEPLVTLEGITVCKRDGRLLEQPPAAAGGWQKLMVYASEHHSLNLELVRRLRSAGAAGATSLRGIWGFHGDHAPHGDTLWQLRRRVPLLTVIVDRAERIPDWFAIVDELTRAAGLVTAEGVPHVEPRRR